MERDKKIEKLVKEHGLLKTADTFTESVMYKVKSVPAPTAYKPIIGKKGRIISLLFLLTIIIVVLLSSSAEATDSLLNIPNWRLQLPEVNLIKIPSVILAGLLAVFILVLTDAGLSKNRS